MPHTRGLVKQVRGARAIVIAIAAAAILLFCAVSWHNYGALHDRRVADAQGDANHALLAINDHITGLIDYADSYLRSLRASYVQHGNLQAFRDYVTQTRLNDPLAFIGEIVVIDADGHPAFISSNPVPPSVELSDLPYFRALKADNTDRMIIDWTRLGRTIKQYQFRVVRPIRVNDQFQGVVVITLRPEAIVDLFQQFTLGPNSTISVFQTEEHRYIARLPVSDRSYYDKVFETLELWTLVKKAPHGFYHRPGVLDGVMRHFVYQQAAGYPIATVIGIADIDIDASLARARAELTTQALFFILAAVIICALVLRVIRVEERLRGVNANLVHAQRMGKIGSVEVDLVAMKATWSDELYRIYDRDRALGPAPLEEFLAYVHPDDRDTVAEMRGQHLHGTVQGPNEYRIILKDGSIRWIHREVEVLRDPSGKPVKLVAAEQDITDQKRLDQAKDAFISTISHELRTPLTSIRGSLGLIAGGASGALPEKMQRLFDIALRNSERLSRLVNDLLDLQRMGSGTMVYHLAEIVLAKVVHDMIEAIRPLAKERGIDISFASTCPDAMVKGDAERLAQVIENLLSNAVKFSKPGQTIAVTIVRRRPWLRITVEDHGEGIPEAFRARIFQRFTQADSSDTRKIGGSGLGLSIVQSIVTQHGGQVSFDTETGRGTRFHVDLEEIEPPASLAAAAKAKTAGSMPAA